MAVVERDGFVIDDVDVVFGGEEVGGGGPFEAAFDGGPEIDYVVGGNVEMGEGDLVVVGGSCEDELGRVACVEDMVFGFGFLAKTCDLRIVDDTDDKEFHLACLMTCLR